MNPQPSTRTYESRTPQGSSLDDPTVVRRIAERDETALATLYDRWVQQVYSLVVNMLRDPDEAEDVVEETFWQVWQRASSYDPTRGTVAAWLLTISRSRALDRMRVRQRQRSEPLGAHEGVLANVIDASNPALDAEGSDQRSRVLQALRELPEDQRRTLELAYYRGLSQSEIAEYLNQPLGTIKTRMRLGMQKLREKLISFHGEGA